MADERQQSLMDRDVSIPDELSQVENMQNVIEERKINIVSPEILSHTLHETDVCTPPTSLSNIENSVLNKNIHPLSDHSYIHSSHSNISIPQCDVTSQDTDSGDVCLKQDLNSKDLQSVIETHNSSLNPNTSENLQTSHSSENTNKINVNGNVLSFSSISNNCSINAFNTIQTINTTASLRTSLPTLKSLIEAPVSDSLNPVFVINKLNSTASITSQDLASIKVPVKQTNAPLGSVENPIQIIQNGNSYLATQTLTSAQKQQITHVLQKQQAKKALETEGKSVIYDPSTKTRIVCRIVHPSELQLQNPHKVNVETVPKAPPTAIIHQPNNSFRGRGRPRKFQSRRVKDEDKNNPALSKEEREEKKKHRPRTRSGRISKPPSYMVKDYKRIHHLDFNEEPYDDSDGGYSDYHVSDEEKGKRSPKSNNLPPGVTTAKQRNYSCQACSKAYIGRGGLSRHFRTHPSHGSMAEGEDVSTQDENSNSSLASSVFSNSGCNTNSQTSSNISNINSQASSSSCSSQMITANPQLEMPKTISEVLPVQTVIEATNNLASNRRKARLREVLKNFPVQDLIEVLLPKFAQEVSLWDFFLARFSNHTNSLNIFEMLKEFEKFLTHMQQESRKHLLPVDLQNVQGKTIINISSKEIASALCLETGPYMVNTVNTSVVGADIEPKSATKDFTLNNNTNDILEMSNEVPLIKRKRLDVSVEDVSSGLPEQILSDAMTDGDNLDLPLSEDNLSRTVELSTQDVHLLTSSINVDNHSDTISKSLFDLNSTTVVTPSSLSSGCLSAVDTPRTAQVSLLTSRTPQKLQNVHLRKLQLFGTQQHQLIPTNDVTISVPVSNLPVSSECNMTDLTTTQQIVNKNPIIVQKTLEMCNGSVENKTFQGMPLDSNFDIFNTSIQTLPTQTVVLDSTAESSHAVSSVSLLNTTNVQSQSVPSDISQTVSAQTEQLVENITNCLPDTHMASSLQNSSSIVTAGLSTLVPSEVNMSTAGTEELREYETTHNVISEVPKLQESSTLLSQVMLPDGQVLSIWAPVENNEKVQNEQFVQNFIPGNLILLQNPDGSIQVPNNQGVPAETLQSLTTLNGGLSSENGTHAFTTVQPM